MKKVKLVSRVYFIEEAKLKDEKESRNYIFETT